MSAIPQLQAAKRNSKARAHIESLVKSKPAIHHDRVLQEVLDALGRVESFHVEAGLKEGDKVTQRHYAIITVQKVLETAQNLQCGICKNADFVYAYNGAYWRQIEADDIKKFLGDAAENLGVEIFTARFCQFRDLLYKQFLAQAYLPTPKRREGVTLINLGNGTFEITATGQRLREFRREDFLTYQLPFDFNETAIAPKWSKFLSEVLPDPARQAVCGEFIGYCFTDLKLEKVFLPYGTGANGKSVFFDVMTSLLGDESIAHFSLSSLGHEYNRAKLANKLLNYASEISTRLESETLKKLASGEPVEARLPYGQPFIITNYAKLAFNCNELPRDVEHTHAFFRRFLIVPFDVTISEGRQNPDLAKEIIADELAGVFNWVLESLRRLLKQRKFTECEAVKAAVEAYKRESDSVACFLADEYESDTDSTTPLREIYADYKIYCSDNGYKPLGRNKFAKRLEANGATKQDTDRPVFFLRYKGGA